MQGSLLIEKSRQKWLITIVAVSVFMFTFDYSMLNISLPTLAHYFNVSVGTVSRLPVAYLLVLTSTLLGFGKLGDIKSYKKVFIIGLIIFTIATLGCGFASNINWLLGLRVCQAIGEAMFSPVGIALLTTFLPNSLRGKALGIIATAQGIGFSLGPVVGGFISANLTWRGIFFVNVPLAILTILLSFKFLPKKQAAITDSRFDLIGACLIFIALAALLYALNNVVKMGWTNYTILLCLATAIIGFIFFAIRENKIAYPLLDVKLCKNLSFTFANLSAFLAIAVLIGITFLMPFYLQLIFKLSVSQAGLMLMLPAIMMMLLGPVAGEISDKISPRKLCSVAMIPAIVAFILLVFTSQQTSIFYIGLALVFLGVAFGMFMAPNNKLIMTYAPADKQGIASGVYKTIINIGSVFGIAIFTLVLAQSILIKVTKLQLDRAMIKHSPDIMLLGFNSIFILGIICCLISLVFSVLTKQDKQFRW